MVLRRGGFYPVVQLRDEMNRFMGDLFAPAGRGIARESRESRAAGGFPALNVWEAEDNFFVEAEMPGLKHEDLEITVVGADLTVRGTRKRPVVEGATYHRQERGEGEFARTLRLPVEVDSGRVEATLSDGVLLVKLPKAESAKPRKIQVNAG